MPPAAQGHQTLSAYISSRFDEFSRSQKDVAQYVVDHLDEVAFHTAEELARRANTSSSTVVRFSQALGFEGFPELQEAAREEYRHLHRKADPTNGTETATPLFSLDQSPFESAIAADHVNVEETARKVSRSEVERGDRGDRDAREGADRRHRPDGVLRLLPAPPADAARHPRRDRRLARRRRRSRGSGGSTRDTLVIGLSRRAPAPARRARDEDRPPPQGGDAGDHRRDAVRGRQARRSARSTTPRTRPAFVRSHTGAAVDPPGARLRGLRRDAAQYDDRIRAFRLK